MNDPLQTRANELNVEWANDTYYLVCRLCGHVECVPGHYDLEYRCESCCKSASSSRFDDEDEAYDFSQEIVDKKRCVQRVPEGEMQHGW